MDKMAAKGGIILYADKLSSVAYKVRPYIRVPLV